MGIGNLLKLSNTYLGFVYDHVVENVIEKAHAQYEVLSRMKQIFVRRNIVAKDILGAPTAE